MHKSLESDLRPAAVRLHFLPDPKALPRQKVIFSPCRCTGVLTLTYPSSKPFPQPESVLRRYRPGREQEERLSVGKTIFTLIRTGCMSKASQFWIS